MPASDTGKGSDRRKRSSDVSWEDFSKNWENTFGKKKQENKEKEENKE